MGRGGRTARAIAGARPCSCPILIAGIRAHEEIDRGRPLTWALLLGLTTILAGAGLLWGRLR
ncbi:MAG: hypothetical protein ACRD29_25960, partial [Acidimicrobiales bacterium]